MSVEITHTRPPIPAHLASVRRFGLGLARWASRAAARRAVRLEAKRARRHTDGQVRSALLRAEHQRELAQVQWQLRQLR